MTAEMLVFLAAPLAAALVIAALHNYMGLHVVARGVIFVDLALAQIAALGALVAFVLGKDIHSASAYVWSLGAVLCGAALFSLVRLRKRKIPQEAIIGITYVVCTAAAVVLVNQLPEGTEHIKGMLVGSILTVSWPDIAKIAAVYAALGLFHWIFRKRFHLLSYEPERAEKERSEEHTSELQSH